jgi:PAS domain S-box-containing protein
MSRRPLRKPHGSRGASLSSRDALAFLDTLPFPTWVIHSRSFAILAANEAACALYEFSRDEFLSMSLYDIRRDNAQLQRNGKEPPAYADVDIAGVAYHKTKSNALLRMQVAMNAITFDEESAILVAACNVGSDDEERSRIVLEQSGKLVYDYDVASGMINWSGAIEQITGYRHEEMCTVDIKGWELMIHPDDRQSALDELEKSKNVSGHYDVAYRFRRKSGAYAYIQDTGVFLRNAGGGTYRMLGTMGDVTEQVTAEQALRESEERYRQFFEEDLTGDFISTSGGSLLSCNPAFVRMFGFGSLEEALATNMSELFPSTAVRAEYLELVRKKGKLDYHEMELRRRDGRSVYVVETVIGSFGENGELLQLKGYIFDNSERKKLEDQLLQSQKMEAVGQLASGIAHDFNNVMGVVLTAAHLLGRKSTDPDVLRYAKMIEDATLRGSGIARQLLQFSRAEAVKLMPVSLSQTVLEVKRFLEHSFPKTIEIDVRIAMQHGLVMADAGQIHQLILNLCINARDAILARTDRQSSGSIEISLEQISGHALEEKYGWKVAPQYALLSVSDDGMGIPESIRRRIFDPFFTTKGIGKGTGLGLSIVHGIVKAHNGIIDVDSQEGQGTTFQIYLPAIHHQIILDQQVEGDVPRGHGESILVIEDEPSLRSLLREFLEGAGYNVLEAVDGEEGVAMYARHKDAIDLVLSDIGLPKLDGEHVLGEIRKMNPSARVIFCTGFIEEETRALLLQHGAIDVLRKPFRIPTVLRVVRGALDARLH